MISIEQFSKNTGIPTCRIINDLVNILSKDGLEINLTLPVKNIRICKVLESKLVKLYRI